MNLTAQFTSKPPVIQESISFEEFSTFYGKQNFSDFGYIQLFLDKNNLLHIEFNAENQGEVSFILNNKYYKQRELLSNSNDVLQACKRYFNGRYDYKIYYSFQLVKDEKFTFSIPKEITQSRTITSPSPNPVAFPAPPVKKKAPKAAQKSEPNPRPAPDIEFKRKTASKSRFDQPKRRRPQPKSEAKMDSEINLFKDFFKGLGILIGVVLLFRSCF